MSDDDRERSQAGLPVWVSEVRPGTFDRRVLDHGFWITDEGEALSLRSMSTAHLQNVVRMLEQQAHRLHLDALLDVFGSVLEADLDGRTSGERLAHELGVSIVDCGAVEWLHGTTLLRAIDRELRARESELRVAPEMLPGLSPEQLAGWSDSDRVASAVSRYSDPPVTFGVVPLLLSSGASVVALEVVEFDTTPHLCVRDYPWEAVRGAASGRTRWWCGRRRSGSLVRTPVTPPSRDRSATCGGRAGDCWPSS